MDALNFGISKSNSDLIARMDGDDLMHPIALKNNLNSCSKTRHWEWFPVKLLNLHTQKRTRRRLCSLYRLDQSDSFF